MDLTEPASYRTVAAGTILYSGFFSDLHAPCPHPFRYVGQSGRHTDQGKGSVVFFTTHRPTAEGYAQCHPEGWVRKYRVFKSLQLFDNTQEFAHMEGDEVAKLCKSHKNKKIHGCFIEWAKGVEEIAICHPERFVKYVGSYCCRNNDRNEFSGQICPGRHNAKAKRLGVSRLNLEKMHKLTAGAGLTKGTRAKATMRSEMAKASASSS